MKGKRQEKTPTAVEIRSNFVLSSAHFEFQFVAPHQVGEHRRLSSKLTRSLINTEPGTYDQCDSPINPRSNWNFYNEVFFPATKRWVLCFNVLVSKEYDFIWVEVLLGKEDILGVFLLQLNRKGYGAGE